MKFEDLAEQLDPEIYARFKKALSLGKWPDGRVLTAQQKEICMQSVILYEIKHDIPQEQRLGFVDKERKQSACGSKPDNDADTVRILH